TLATISTASVILRWSRASTASLLSTAVKPSCRADRAATSAFARRNEGGLPHPLPPGRGRHAHHFLEGAAEGGFRLVANLGGDRRHVGIAAVEHFGGDLHPPFREIMHRRGAGKLHKAFGHDRARGAALPRQSLDGPVERRPRVDQRQRLA